MLVVAALVLIALPRSQAVTVCSSSLSGVCVTSVSHCPSSLHIASSYCGSHEYCCYPSSSSSSHTTTHAPHTASTCSSSLSGVCVTSVSHCPSGLHLSYSYCGFLEYCCYPSNSHNSGSSSHTTTQAPHASTSHATCGVPAVSDHHRIVGGQQAQLGEYPWQVSLRYHGQHLCGGTLIDNQWVLTAAHCFEQANHASYWTVAFGISDINSVSSSHVSHAAHIYVHGSYDDATNANDIALIKLSHHVDLSGRNARTACLPDHNENFESLMCTVTGWGATHTDGGAVRYLREVDIPIMSNSLCQYYIGRGGVHSSNICGGFSQGGKDSCQGDSGGPLVCKKNGAWKLAGVVSWGYGCAMRNSPGVYTRVSSYLSWISSVKAQHG